MADIFLSYASDDRERVRPLVERLEEYGWDVWWDREIPPGMTWPQVIEKALADTRAMVVVWTEASVTSNWVLIETSEGQEGHGLVPVRLDHVKPPLQFRLIQSADLVGWDGSPSHPQFRAVVDQLESTLGVPTRVVQERERQAEAATEAKRKADEEAAAEAKRNEDEEAKRKADEDAEAALEEVLGVPTVPNESTPTEESPTDGTAAETKLVAKAADDEKGEAERDAGLKVQAPAPRTGWVQYLRSGFSEAGRWASQATAVAVGLAVTVGVVVSVWPDPLPTIDTLNTPIWIEGGTFQMGSTSRDSEQPVHQVTLSGFWLQEHEVTNEEYRRFVASHQFPSGQERYPVVRVDWQDAMDYAAYRGGSLPTEAQWEFATRGTAGRTYPWEEADPTCELTQMNGCDGDAIAVMSRPNGATPEGVHDLAGNVSEWVADRYGPYGAAAATDPTGPDSGTSRVLRGGSFVSVASYLRGSYRNGFEPGLEYDGVGFRVAWPGGQD